MFFIELVIWIFLQKQMNIKGDKLESLLADSNIQKKRKMVLQSQRLNLSINDASKVHFHKFTIIFRMFHVLFYSHVLILYNKWIEFYSRLMINVLR